MFLLACAASEPVCEIGRSEACTCTDGRRGAQACEGDAWAACVCTGDTAAPVEDTETRVESGETGETGDSGETAETGDTGDTGPLPVQVYLLAGQSNMDGYAYATGLPPSLQLGQTDVWLYWSGNAAWTGDAPASFGTAAYGVEYFGPEVTFGRALADAAPDAQIALVKHAVGGTDLASYWYPGVSRTDVTAGQGYRDFLATVDGALGALDAEGVDYEIAGMIWMQGESDALATEAQALAYEGNLTRFIARVRDDVAAPDMPFVIGKIHCPTCTYGDIVRDAEDAVAAADPNVTAFATDDLPINNDGIHYDGSGMRTLGQRFAAPFTGVEAAPTAAPAFRLTGGYSYSYTGDFFLGYALRVDQPVIVTDLGTFDAGLTGLVSASQVVIYDATTLDIVARTTVPAWATNPTTPWDQWRFAAIEPVALDAGLYLIAAQVYNGSEDIYTYGAVVEPAEGFHWIEGRHKNGTGVGVPTNVSDLPMNWLGPNLLYVTP